MSIFITVIHICGLNWCGSNYYIYKLGTIVILGEENTFYYHILHTCIIDTFQNLSFECINFTLWISSVSNDCKLPVFHLLLLLANMLEMSVILVIPPSVPSIDLDNHVTKSNTQIVIKLGTEENFSHWIKHIYLVM